MGSRNLRDITSVHESVVGHTQAEISTAKRIDQGLMRKALGEKTIA